MMWGNNQFFIGGGWGWGVFTIRICKQVVQLKAPWNPPLFSERNGYYQKRFVIKGWRILFRRNS